MEDMTDGRKGAVNAQPDEKWGTALLFVSISTGCIVLATCFFRGYVRFRTSTYVRLNDIYVSLAVTTSLPATVFTIYEGLFMCCPTHALAEDWSGQLWYMQGTVFAGMSICDFVGSLGNAPKSWHTLVHFQNILMTVINFIFCINVVWHCSPMAKLWISTIPGTCWREDTRIVIAYFQGAYTIYWWMFLALAHLVVAKDIERRPYMQRMIRLMSTLCVAVSIFATVRTYARAQYVPDVFTYNHFLGTIMSILEQNVGIVAANLLPIGLLFEHRRDATLIPGAENLADDDDARELDWNNGSAYELQNQAWQSNSRLAGLPAKQPTTCPAEGGVRSAASAEDIHNPMLQAVVTAMLSGAPNAWSSSETMTNSTFDHSLSDLVVSDLNVLHDISEEEEEEEEQEGEEEDSSIEAQASEP